MEKGLTNNISTSFIDDCYSSALQAGAQGGKILGAGSGGFLMLYAPKNKHSKIISALSKLQKVDIGFEPFGSKIIFYH